MKIHVVSEIGWEYNDENYFRPESGGVKPLRGYKNKATAETECDKLNADANKDINTERFVDDEGQPITIHYEVVSIEMEDN